LLSFALYGTKKKTFKFSSNVPMHDACIKKKEVGMTACI
jgi:hypothetical protein